MARFLIDLLFVASVILLLSRAKGTSSMLLANHGNHIQVNKLSLNKRSIYVNPLLVYRCSLPLGLENGRVPDAAFSASSSHSAKDAPVQARLNIQANGKHHGSWAAKTNDGKQWLQIDFGELVRVTKLATQGRQNSADWITKFTVSYSFDGMHWAEYKENSVTWVSKIDKEGV